MLTKEQFIVAMNDIVENYNFIMGLEGGLGDYISEHSLIDSYIKTLELSMGCVISEVYGGTISWWIYDTDCGKDRPYVYLKPHNSNKQIKLKIKTVEDLYDYIIKYESINTEK